ncbi:MAG: bifunctional phosphopantothenoylcysteine decarboxylase/phosphopantothenate--cysteine ligase CoaBC [Patescibacteria group bacterium]|nr:bifunctional phosphopantothenoylcysteine decarboxylase/phosphopantothenate--cysteine ligase CoaBC [Patescibacteria group bacterium]
MNYLQNKKILIGVTAGAAIYKTLDLIRRLKENGAQVQVVMTENAKDLISEKLFSAISGGKAMEHIELQEVDLAVVAPATANFIGKAANGIADDFLTTTILASNAPLLVVPAMNEFMLNKPQVQLNIVKLLGVGAHFCGPVFGELACGSQGYGRMSEVSEILANIERIFAPNDLKGKKVLVTAGPTRESWDDIRFLSNRSSGKMGYGMAKEAWLRGAEVTLITGPTALPKPYDTTVVEVETADKMFDAVSKHFPKCDYFVSAAAVSDFEPEKVKGKIKKDDGVFQINLQRTVDILRWCGDYKSGQTIIGFALEADNSEERGRAKMIEKKCDFMVANLISNMEFDSGKCIVFGKNNKMGIAGLKSEMAVKIWDFVSLG